MSEVEMWLECFGVAPPSRPRVLGHLFPWTVCERCGAMTVLLDHTVHGFDPLLTHVRWHLSIEGRPR